MYEFGLPTFPTGIASFQDLYLISEWFMGSHGTRDHGVGQLLTINVHDFERFEGLRIAHSVRDVQVHEVCVKFVSGSCVFCFLGR
jgi:hypothetical protein